MHVCRWRVHLIPSSSIYHFHVPTRLPIATPYKAKGKHGVLCLIWRYLPVGKSHCYKPLHAAPSVMQQVKATSRGNFTAPNSLG